MNALAGIRHSISGTIHRGRPPQFEVQNALTSTGLVVDENARFPVGSLGKVFTALAVLQAVERGQLSFQTELATLLPEVRLRSDFRSGQPIQIEHLLTHSAGLPTEVAAEETFGRRWELDELPRMLSGAALIHPPGQRAQYSNVGYDLLGLVLQRISGQSFEDFMTERVFDPLGLEGTGYCFDEQTIPGDLGGADGALLRGPAFTNNDLPSGGLIMSAYALSVFMQHLLHAGTEQSLLSAGVRERLTTASPYRPLPGVRQQPGVPAMGFFVERRCGAELPFHTGGKPGYLAYCHYLHDFAYFTLIAGPSLRSRVLWKQHVAGVERLLGVPDRADQDRDVERDFFGFASGDCLDELPAYEASQAVLREFVGKYAVLGYYDIYFEIRAGCLYTDYGEMAELRAIGPAEFVAVRYLPGERVRFVWEADGSAIAGVYVSLTYHAKLRTEADVERHLALMARRFGAPKTS
ncbi:MAG TPA: serine hydrolase domain-containing protein [Polyangiaceae bacterium]|nr:serine hydrolase domain-containing protein [Polyangiaceae bacterium]